MPSRFFRLPKRLRASTAAIASAAFGEGAFKSFPQVRLFDPRVRSDLGRGALEGDLPGLEHVGALGVAQGRVGVLLDQENGNAGAMDLLDRLEDRVDDDRREAERGLVEQKDARLRHESP